MTGNDAQKKLFCSKVIFILIFILFYNACHMPHILSQACSLLTLFGILERTQYLKIFVFYNFGQICWL